MMKLQISKFIAASMVVIAAFTVSCGIDDANFNHPDNSVDSNGDVTEETGTGYLTFSSLAVTVNAESEDFNTKATDNTIDTGDYIVDIVNEDSDSEQEPISMTYNEIMALNDKIELAVGQYTLKAKSYSDELASLGWDQPEYASKEYSFTITEGETSEFADDVICTLANIKATVKLSDELLAKFKSENLEETDTPLTVTLQLGDVTATYSLNEAGELVGEAGDVVYFAPQDDNDTIVMTLSGMYNTAADGDEAKYVAVEWSQEIAGVAAGQYRNITINLASTGTGSSEIEVSVVSTLSNNVVDVDIMNGSFFENGEDALDLDGDNSGEDTDETPDDDATLTGGLAIVWDGGDLSVRHTISSSSTLSVVINITSETGIDSLSLQINSDVLTEDMLSEMSLSQNMDLVNPETDNMASALGELGFPTGDAIEGQTSLTIDITEFMPALAGIANSGDETDFVITVGDASGTNTETIMLIVE
ncbi:MAG: DUF4493 domain-containing protein [Rikenellaceae bacterium]